MSSLSVIIPLGPQERCWGGLLGDLLLLPASWELVFVGCAGSESLGADPRFQRLLAQRPVRWLISPAGRAQQLNAGARAARGRFLWFLHLDSHFGPQAWRALQQAVDQAPQALHYFQLAFLADGPRGMRLNAWGANLRSRLGIPFGDQGFCLSRELFERLGGYPESAPYGEDHLLVWRAHRRRVPLRCTGVALYTSARKYHQRGWGYLTLTYQWLWLRQALPEGWRWIRGL